MTSLGPPEHPSDRGIWLPGPLVQGYMGTQEGCTGVPGPSPWVVYVQGPRRSWEGPGRVLAPCSPRVRDRGCMGITEACYTG